MEQKKQKGKASCRQLELVSIRTDNHDLDDQTSEDYLCAGVLLLIVVN